MRKLSIFATTALVVALAMVVSSVTPVGAAATTLVASPANTQGWQVRTSGTGQTVTFETGPATPPLGTGSVELSVGPNGAGAAQLRHPGYAGTKLDDLTALSYYTYVDQDGSGGQAPYIMLQVDLDGNLATTGDRTLLFFEPAYQTGTFFPSNPQPALALDTWQQWDALNGGWWSTTGAAGANPGTGVKSLNDIISVYPNAVIHNSANGDGGVRIVAGFGAGAWDNFIGNVDAFKIGVNNNDTTYNFEADADGDGFDDPTDNCDFVSNPGQQDADGDQIGDACDTCPNDAGNDADGDGVCGDADNCPFVPNPGQADFDGDGIGDACGDAAPTTREQCKNGGWQNWVPRFRNQGDCIQYVNTGK